MTILEPNIAESCAMAAVIMGVEGQELTCGSNVTAIHRDFVYSAGIAIVHMLSWAIVHTILSAWGPLASDRAASRTSQIRRFDPEV